LLSVLLRRLGRFRFNPLGSWFFSQPFLLGSEESQSYPSLSFFTPPDLVNIPGIESPLVGVRDVPLAHRP